MEEVLERDSTSGGKKKKIWENLGISSDKEFEQYLRQQYETKGIEQIAKELGFQRSKSLKRYFIKYNIELCSNSEYHSEDLTGQIINGIKFLAPTEERSSSHIKWECKCRCGNIWMVSCSNIKSHTTTSCGKCRNYNKITKEQKDEIIEFRKNNPAISSYKIKKQLNLLISPQRICSILQREGLSNLHNQPDNKHQCWKGYGIVPKRFWSKFKDGAEKRHIPYLITIEEIMELYNEQGGVCKLSGEKLSFCSNKNRKEWNASLDRIDSSLGYSKSNCQLVTKDINKAKQQMSNDEFIKMCKQVAAKVDI